MGHHSAALGFFDERITLADKRKMLKELEKDKSESEDTNRRLPSDTNKTYKLVDCISRSTKDFFEIMRIGTDFLAKDPKEWSRDISYEEAKKRVSYLHVVNDAAERGLSYITRIPAGTNESHFQDIAISKSFEKKN